MTDPRHPADSPRQTLFQMMSSGPSVVWFSSEAKPSEMLTEVARLLGTGVFELAIVDAAFAFTPERDVLIAVLRNAARVAVCAVPTGETGFDRIVAAMDRDWAETVEALGRGDYGRNGFSKEHAVLVRGEIHSDFEGSNVLDYVDGADLVALG